MAAIKWKGWYQPCNCCGEGSGSGGGGDTVILGPTPENGKTEFFYKTDADPAIGDCTANQPYDNQIIIPGPGDGTLTFKDADGNVVGTFTADQEGDVEIVFPETFSGDYNDLNNLPDINDGKFRVIASDGVTVLGEFTANQATNSQVVLPKVDFNDLDNKPAVNDGQINVEGTQGVEITGTNATANQAGNTTRTIRVKTGNGLDIDVDGNVIIDPNFNLDGNVTAPNDGKLTIKDSDGSPVGTFTANQAGDTDVTLPKGFSGSYNDLTDKPAIGNGAINVNGGDGIAASGNNATANQSGATTRTLAVDTNWLGSWIDTNRPNATVNNGKLTIKDSGGASLGEFTANQAGNTEVNLPAGFSGNYNDLSNKPSIGNGKLTIKDSGGTSLGEFTANQGGATTVTLPAGFSGNYNDLTNKPSFTEFPEAPADGNVYVRNGKTKSWVRGLPYDVRTLPPLP